MEPRSTRARALVLTSAVVLVAAAACSSRSATPGEATTGAILPVGPDVASSSPVPSTGTASPGSASPAPLPAAARERTKKGAEAFVRHFLAEYNRAVTVPASGLLQPLGLPSCKTCAGLEKDSQALVDDDERYEVAPLRIDGVTCVACGAEQLQSTWFINTWLHLRACHIVNREGRPVQTIKATDDAMQFELAWSPQGWRAAKIRMLR